jgi:hypothetical protein
MDHQATMLTILSGDGDSPESPIKFSVCDVKTRVAAEYRYICDRFGIEDVNWERGMHLTRPFSISDWNITLSDGSTRSVYFDTSNTIYKDE